MSHESSEGVGAQGAAKRTDSKEELRRVVSRPMPTFFIIGDILGTGIYALVGEVGANVGGAIWVSFLVTILVTFVTAFAYAELVTKCPYAAGAALMSTRPSNPVSHLHGRLRRGHVRHHVGKRGGGDLWGRLPHRVHARRMSRPSGQRPRRSCSASLRSST